MAKIKATLFTSLAIHNLNPLCFRGLMGWQDKAKEIIEQKKITQEQLAERMGVSVPAVSRYLAGERGKNNLNVIKQVANAIDVPWMALLAETPLDEKIIAHLGNLTGEQKQNLLAFLRMASQLNRDTA